MKQLLPANYLTIAEAAPKLGMTENALYKSLQRESVPGAVKLGSAWLIDLNKFKRPVIGRPPSKKRRCACGASTEKRAKARAYDCCKRAGLMERWR